MARGMVKWFNPTKGYGFIQPQAGGRAERAYFANYRQRWPDYSPVGRAEWNHRMVNNMKRRKQKANTSKPASSPPLNAPAQALSGDETKRRMALVNADREIVRKIMTEPGPRWEPQGAENAANFFRSREGGVSQSRLKALASRSRKHGQRSRAFRAMPYPHPRPAHIPRAGQRMLHAFSAEPAA